MSDRVPADQEFRGKLALTLGWTMFLVLLFLLVWLAAPVLFLIFGALLVGVLLRGIAEALHRSTGLPQGWSLGVGVVALLGVVVGSVILLAPHVSSQMAVLSDQLPRSIESLKESLGESSLGAQVIEQLPSVNEFVAGEIGLSRVTGWFSSTIGLVANLILLFFVGLYVAANPEPYRSGLVRLFPKRHRRRADETIGEVHTALYWWLLGQFAAMAIVGLLTAVGLWILGIPLALTLGLIAAILAFIPNFGPIASFIPAGLLGLMVSPSMFFWVLILYVGVQTVESYLITPQIHKRTVTLPPALTIVSQLLFGILFGLPGLVFATPLVAVLLVLVKMIYVEDVLGDSHVHLPSDDHQ